MISTGFRTKLAAALLAALLAIGSLALAQPKFRVNGKDNAELSHNATRVHGHVMAPARPFFNQFGANIEKRGDWYHARRGDHDFRFRPGDRTYYDNDRPYYFHEAPFERNGSLLLSIGDLTVALGGRYDWDDRYQRANIWYGPVPPVYGGGYRPVPVPVPIPLPRPVPGVQLQIASPKNYGRVSARAVTVVGYATPYADVRILIYRSTRSGDVRVFDTPGRTDANGYYSMRLPMYGGGTYSIQVQLLDSYGRSMDSKRIVVYAS